jgi:hypothetical protein
MATGNQKRWIESENLPETPGEWQEAADGANFLLILDAARQFGLITGVSVPNVDRCELILAEARRRGITPRGFDV